MAADRGDDRGSGAARRRRSSRRLRAVAEHSAGGLVVNARHEAVLIGRRSRRGGLMWSLPKGHIEHGETAEQAAVREIHEETGSWGRVVTGLGSIDFWFVAGSSRVHKTVQHFLLEFVGGELFCDDHEVAAVAWIPLLDLEAKLAYPDERGLAARAGDLASRFLG
jgi:8-oxo-dGTP pyrophosphatase MutT (NUDIX family)